MSLDWDATKCGPAWKELEWYERNALIFATISAGIGHITRQNFPEFWARWVAFNRLNGLPNITEDPEGITMDKAKAAIGLVTNVRVDDSIEPDAEWAVRVMKHSLRDIRDEAERSLKRSRRVRCVALLDSDGNRVVAGSGTRCTNRTVPGTEFCTEHQPS